MWIYEKKLQYPANVSCKDPRMAKLLMAQYGGPDSELSAALRYLTQRYSMPTNESKGILTDIGTEEFAHLEIIATLIYKLTDDASVEELKRASLGGNYIEHDCALYYADANGVPWTATYLQSTGDPIADITEDMAAEQKARMTYEHLISATDDPCVIDALRFLWQREVTHFQRFGEALRIVTEYTASKKVY